MLTRLRTALLLCLLSFCALAAKAATLNVGPGQQYTTIQSAINAATNGDTVLVSPGTYYEQITCAKAITIMSSAGAASTFIDGSQGSGFIVTMGTPLASDNSFRAPTILDGFTIQNGPPTSATFASDGGGITISGNATVRNNTVLDNYPSGITVRLSNALIQNNHILQTIHTTTAGHSSTGIVIASTSVFPYAYLHSPPSLTITNNLIENNLGNGILNFYAVQNDPYSYPASPYLFNYTNNLIRTNGNADQTAGLDIFAFGGTHVIAGNLITGNSGTGLVMELAASRGSFPPYQPTGVATNNTIVANNTAGLPNQGTELGIFGVPQTFTNNLVVHTGNSSSTAIYCGQGTSGLGGTPVITQPVLDHNDLYAPNSPALTPSGTGCVGTWTNNRFEDPLFANVATADFHLMPASPEIDTGDNNAPSLPATDLDGKPRIVDGTGKGTAIVDLGAYEFSGTYYVSESLTSSQNPSLQGQSVTFTAKLSASSGTPTGSILFSDGGIPLAIAPISTSAMATLTTNALSIGLHALTAAYQPTGTFTATSASLTQQVTEPGTTTTLTCNPNPITINTNALFFASVIGSDGTTPMGTVAFTDNGAPLGQPLLVNGNTSLSYLGSTAGTHIIVATTFPIGAYSGSSATCTETVSARSTTLSLATSLTPSNFAQPVTFTATATYQSQGTNPAGAGSVTFSDGATPLQTVTVGANLTAVYTTGSLLPGNHTITATLNPPANYSPSSASVAQVVSGYPTTSTFVNTPTQLNYGVPLVLTATVASATPASTSTPTGTVNFFVDGVQIGIPVPLSAAALASQNFGPTPLSVGSHQLACFYNGSTVYSSSACGILQVTIVPAPTTTTLVATPSTVYFGQPVTFTAAVAAGGIPVKGTLNLGGTRRGSQAIASSNNGSLVYTTSSLAVGVTGYAANYLGDINTLASNSPAASVTVLANTSTTSLTVSPTPAYQGQPVTMTAVVANAAGLTPTGSLTFYDGTQPLGTSPLTANRATLTTTQLAPGTHTLTAIYAGDPSTPTSTSPAVSEIILPSDFTFTATPGTLSLATGHHMSFTLTAASTGAFAGQLGLSVDRLPVHATLNIKQPILTVAQGGQSATSVYLDTDDVIGYLSSNRTPLSNLPIAALLLLPLAAFIGKRRRRLPTLLLLALSAWAITSTTGCSGKYPASVAPGTYTLRVTATSPQTGIAHTAEIPLIVTQ